MALDEALIPPIVTLLDGTRVLTLPVDFSQDPTQILDFTAMKSVARQEGRTIFCDLSKTDSDLLIKESARDTPQITALHRTAGLYPCFFAAPLKLILVFSGSSQLNPVNVQVYDRLINGPTWGVTN